MNSQEQFWTGPFGNEYTERSRGRLPANVAFFRKVMMHRLGSPQFLPPNNETLSSAIEFGAGAGENLQALADLIPGIDLNAVEINAEAIKLIAQVRTTGRLAIFENSMLNWPGSDWADLAFTKGVLIHIAPEDLPRAYDVLHSAARRYILIAEYYSKETRTQYYRGHAGKLWAADFGGEMLDRHPDLKLLDVGFHYDRTTGQDNITHWLMEKK